MEKTADSLSPAELLETAEKLYATKDPKMMRAAILEAITALEATVRELAFSALKEKLGEELSKWLEDKTKMDFDSRLGLFVPIATGLTIDKTSKLWEDYKKAKQIRNRVTHSGANVVAKQARSVIDTVYEWIAYLNSAQEVEGKKDSSNYELIGRLLEASARLERVIYSALVKFGKAEEKAKRLIPNLNDLAALNLISPSQLNELQQFRKIRNHAAHSHPEDLVKVTEAQVKRFNELIDEIEQTLKKSRKEQQK